MHARFPLLLLSLLLVALLPGPAQASYRHVCTFGQNVCFDQDAFGDADCRAYHEAYDRLHVDVLVADVRARGERTCDPEHGEPEREAIVLTATGPAGTSAALAWRSEDQRTCELGLAAALPLGLGHEETADCGPARPPDPGWGHLVP